jgi:hypothetical protein
MEDLAVGGRGLVRSGVGRPLLGNPGMALGVESGDSTYGRGIGHCWGSQQWHASADPGPAFPTGIANFAMAAVLPAM